MILIAHRGNINGKIPEKENSPVYLTEALAAGYNIEVDLWHTKSGLSLGHDAPQYAIDKKIFSDLDPDRTWYHAKNAEALSILEQKKILNFFWIENDVYTLTSKGYIWVHTKTPLLLKGSICVLPEERPNTDNVLDCAGICSDFVERYR